ncbi:MAG TPA: ABC transporter ATP-binding protein [Clostridiaceae bacterium]
MSKVEICHVSMNYQTSKSEISALVDINLSISNGEFVSIVGPSGCGKSTLLNIISGLIKPSKGEIIIDGIPKQDYSQNLGYMFQRDHLFEWLTVWDNVILGLKVQHKLDDKNKEILKALLINYNLWNFKDNYPRELSGGMRQRVALIRTLALNPDVLLLDEPFSALDFQSRLRANDEISEMIKNEGKTAIMVTHDISEAISMSSKVVILSKRPASIKKEVNIDFLLNYNTPLKRREAEKFRLYFNEIWKEIDVNHDGE